MLEFRLNSINIKPAMTYSRAGRTTIGPRCLSAVFGMGTGVSTWAWSPAISELAPVAYAPGSPAVESKMIVNNEDDASSNVSNPDPGGGRDGAAKRLAVSTGPLKALLPVH